MAFRQTMRSKHQAVNNALHLYHYVLLVDKQFAYSLLRFPILNISYKTVKEIQTKMFTAKTSGKKVHIHHRKKLMKHGEVCQISPDKKFVNYRLILLVGAPDFIQMSQ